MFVTLLWICPQFNCWVKPPAQTPGCPVPELFLSTHVFLSLGASVFVLATLQRFLRVYSLLSRKRYMFLCACTVLVVLVLIGRLGAIAFWTLVRLSSFDTWAVDSPMRKLAHQVNRISYLVFFLTMTSLALVALLLGLQFVLNVRANLARVAHQSPPLPSLPAHSGSTASNGDDVPHKRKLHHQQIRHNRRIVIGWIILSILMLCNFGFVGLVLKDQLPKPANLFNSLLLMLVKMLVAAVSMAMSEVVKLATATDHGENSGRS
ncbi:hypothetical protein BCR44DRAFT_35914 [Catenaria anguillulae PL171]|uniref:Uncharacterized protein n=1 Tax=Catenaria anguillulae PL171 TaxID=765915 RepID=A0A1Y2HGW0_9FUNG|nr:hypothetical protein BCR44DRAFT_35914 [Catenaria anguillulae PL171]